MNDKIYALLKNDKLKYVVNNWNKEEFTIQNKVQALKELIDSVADYVYSKNGLDYSKTKLKYSLFPTSLKYFDVDKKELGKNSIVVFQEDLHKKKDMYELVEDYLKICEAVKRDLTIDQNDRKYYVLRDIELDEYTKIELEASKKVLENSRK